MKCHYREILCGQPTLRHDHHLSHPNPSDGIFENVSSSWHHQNLEGSVTGHKGKNASGKNSNHQNSSLPWLVVATNPPPPFLHLHFSISALLVALECGDAEATVLPPLRSDGRIQEARQQWKQRRERVSINRGCKLCGQGTESDVEAPWKV